MEARQSKTVARRTGARTNSLAFAKHDCHTCAGLHEVCDRRRPQCGTCLAQNRTCGGFVLDLTWRESVQMRSHNAPPSEPLLDSRSAQARGNFTFIQGRPKRKRKVKESKSAQYQSLSHQWRLSSSTSKASTCRENSEVDATKVRDRESPAVHDLAVANEDDVTVLVVSSAAASDDSPQSEDSPSTDSCTDSSRTNEHYDRPNDTLLIPYAFNDYSNDSEDQHHLILFDGATTAPANVDCRLDLNTLPSTLAHASLADKYRGVLELYDQYFCVIPLSGDCPSNPFRFRMNRIGESPYLLHAVMAIASQHLAKQNNDSVMAVQTRNHWSTAIKLFSLALERPEYRSILDTLIVLINFEVTQSATATFGIHLNGACKVLEQTFADQMLHVDVNLRGQVAMLVWWDVTIAFLSRKEPRLPLRYLDALMTCGETSDWSFFALNGCPLEFVQSMARLAKLASIYQLTTRMEWTIFNDLPVTTEEAEMQHFANPEATTLESIEHTNLEEDMNVRRNKFHCIEAWRHAILLYVSRVFTQHYNRGNMQKITHLARLVLDHVRCIPQVDIIQKQVLLPVFLAGAETESVTDRDFVRQYCKHWSDTSRFYHFHSALELLEEIWCETDLSSRYQYWWGLRIGYDSISMTHNMSGDTSMISEVLLG